jgi:cell division protein ZapA (FtsZ GTPase activity inhibitor)
MKAHLKKRLEDVRAAVGRAREGLEPDEDKELLEELAGDIDGYLDCLREEAEADGEEE